MKPSQAITVLRDAGLTDTVIAAAVGSNQSTIHRIRHEKHEPNYTLGKALVDMAMASLVVTGKTEDLKAA